MRFFSTLFSLAAAGSVVAAPGPSFDSPTPTIKRASKFQFVGVNQAGAEFGNKEFPGTLGKHYTWPVHSAIDVSARPLSWPPCELTTWLQTLNTKGFNTHRIAFMM
jgi:endoglucanase